VNPKLAWQSSLPCNSFAHINMCEIALKRTFELMFGCVPHNTLD